MRAALVATALLSVTALAQQPTDSQRIHNAEHSIREMLKDPESARFKNVDVVRVGARRTVCGMVSAKNGLGGYNSPELFFVTDSVAMLASEKSLHFMEHWDAYCSPPKAPVRVVFDGPTTPDSSALFIGDAADKHYFPAKCALVAKIPASARRFFRSEADAVQLHYRPTRGCE